MNSKRGDYKADLIAAVHAEDWELAVRSASLLKWGPESVVASRALSARQSPEIYRQMGLEPQRLWIQAMAAARSLAARFEKIALEVIDGRQATNGPLQSRRDRKSVV